MTDWTTEAVDTIVQGSLHRIPDSEHQRQRSKYHREAECTAYHRGDAEANS